MEEENSPSMIRDWAFLPTVVIQLISEKLNSITDYIRFRSVCLPWRSASLPKPPHLPPQLPWLMLPYFSSEKEADQYIRVSKPWKDDGIRLFYDYWHSKMHKFHLPETIDKMCCASHRGWLLLVTNRGMEVFLLNPITRARVQLPPFNIPVKIFGEEECQQEAWHWFELDLGSFFTIKLSFSTCLTDPNCLITVVLRKACQMFFCRVRDPCWTMVVNEQHENISTTSIIDGIYHDGRFYLLTYEGILRVYNLNYPKERLVLSLHPHLKHVTKSLVEGKSGVYVVAVQAEVPERGKMVFEVGRETGQRMTSHLYQFLEEQLVLQQVDDTIDMAIFYSYDLLSFAVSSDDWESLAGGSLYLHGCCPPFTGKDRYGIYYVKLGSGSPLLLARDIDVESELPIAPAMWFHPSFI